jgi:hypothetical protein
LVVISTLCLYCSGTLFIPTHTRGSYANAKSVSR